MRGTDLYLAMQELDDTIIEKFAQIQTKRSIPLRKLIAASVAAALLVAGSAVGVDAITYTQARDFFTNKGLSTQGLSRYDIKAVYRDIITKTFTYEKTDDVITQGVQEHVPGYEITGDMDNPDDLRELWESWENGELDEIVIDGVINQFDGDTYQKGIWYEKDGTTVYNEVEERSELRETIVRKYENDTLCWESTVPFVARLMKPVGEGTVVIGEKESFMEHYPEPGKLPEDDLSEQIAYLDENGQLLWCKLLTEEESVGFDETDCVSGNSDETFTAITSSFRKQDAKNIRTVNVWRYDLNGEQLSAAVIDINEYTLSDVFLLEDRYVLSLSENGIACKLVLIDANGKVLTDALYQITDQVQHIQDVANIGEYLYISMYTMPMAEGLDERGYPIVTLTQEKVKLWEQRDTLSEKELIECVRKHYTGMLLRCDIKTGEIQSFYSVPGVTADKLEVGEKGELIWYLQSLTEAELLESPNKNICSIWGTSVIHRYVFDIESNLINSENTGELATYRWW